MFRVKFHSPVFLTASQTPWYTLQKLLLAASCVSSEVFFMYIFSLFLCFFKEIAACSILCS